MRLLAAAALLHSVVFVVSEHAQPALSSIPPQYCYKCWDPCPCPDQVADCCGSDASAPAAWTNTSTPGVQDYDGNPLLTAADDLAEWYVCLSHTDHHHGLL